MELFGDEFEICPHCGYIVGTHAEEAIHIEPGTLLYDRYIVGRVLGYGGFGVTYLGWDGKLEQKVAIKEYLPGEFSTRMPGQSQVTVFNGEKNEQFHDGLRKFVEEAKHLAKFQNEEGIVKIFDSFEENDTAYIIMEYLDGETLTEYLRREKTIPEDVAVAMLMPVMESLQAVHDEGLLHRDIAPDNIFLTKSGEVKLIDFGASRYATTSHSRSLTVIIKPGYSPEEQYRSRGDQGPHTDVYAIAATLYKMITGKTPPDAMERRAKYENQNKDILEEPHKINKKISLNRENAILNAMNVRVEDRTPDIAAFIKNLNAVPPVKRVHGKIKKIDLYSWPLWLKIFVPSVLSVILAFGMLLLTGVINFSNFTEEIVVPDSIVIVPDVEGLYKEEALKLIADGKLLASTDGSIESEYVPAGKIILQTPVGGSYMNINGTVLLMISSGKGIDSPENGVATVPYVIWDDKDLAISKLKQAGLAEPNIIEKHDENVAYGSVIEQSVKAGNQVDEGTKITLTISIGPAAFDMPNVVGQTKDKAESTLNSKGLVVVIEYKKTDAVAEGNVISQSVSAGSSVKRGDKVTITVSSGRETIDVANVVGMTQTEAEKTLKDQGFKVSVVENYDTSVEAGRVISQSPGEGTAQLPDSTIVIYVSKGRQKITVAFDANGGQVSPTSVTVTYGATYGNLPTPTKTGCFFEGWYTALNGGTKITATTTVATTSAHTLYAKWNVNAYVLTYDPNGGNVSIGSKTVEYGVAYGALPTPTRDGYIFNGWFTAASGGSEVSSTTTMGAGNTTIYAQWTKIVATSATINNAATKTRYTQGDTFSAAGLTLWVKYNDGTEKIVAYNNCSISSPNMTTVGTKNISVAYDGVSTSYSIVVEELSVALSTDTSNVSSGNIVLRATVPAGTVTWRSNNTAVATVDSNGKVTLKNSTGTATITATVTNGACTATATKRITLSNTSGTKYKETTSATTATVLYATRPDGYTTALPTTGSIPTYSVNSADITGSTVNTSTGKVVTTFANNGVDGYVYYQFNYNYTGDKNNVNNIINWQEGYRQTFGSGSSYNYRYYTSYGRQFYSATDYPEHQANQYWTEYYAIWWAYRDKQAGHTWYVATGISGARAASWYRFPVYNYTETITTYTYWYYSVS